MQLFKADDMSDSLMELVEKTISYTKEFMGASDNSLGNVSPDNTSAILAVQRAGHSYHWLIKGSIFTGLWRIAF